MIEYRAAGENEKAQLAYIMEVLGKPPQSLLATAPRASHFFDIESGTPLPYLDSRGEWRRPASRTLVQALGGCGDAFLLDFLQARLRAWYRYLDVGGNESINAFVSAPYYHLCAALPVLGSGLTTCPRRSTAASFCYR
jgi:hypothetical protein